MKIVIADDTRSARRLLQRTLEKWGFDVIACEDGEQALEALRENEIHVAILDWVMPRMDGLEVCEALQDLDRFVYAMLLTSKTGSGSLTHALERGASDFIVKPFEPAELRARVRVGVRIANLQSQLSKLQKLWSVGRLSRTIARYVKSNAEAVRARVALTSDGLEQCAKMFEKYDELARAARAGTVSPALLDEVDRLRDDSDVEHYLDELPAALAESHHSLERVATTVGEMASFFGTGSAAKTRFDVNRAIERAIQVTPGWREVTEVRTEFAPDLPKVEMVATEFTLAISNLILNATEAIRAAQEVGGARPGTIHIRTQRREGWIEISVADTGCGMSDEVRDHIFEPFFTTKRAGAGFGQGLSHAHAFIVDENQGTIRVESAEGQGTTFWLRVPIG